MQPINNNGNGPRIKTEPGLEQPAVGMNQNNYTNPLLGMGNATTAAQRAAQHLQANYGPRAAASIDAIRGGAPQQQQQQPPPANNGQHNPQQVQQQQQQNVQNMQHPQQQPQRPGVPPQQQGQQRPSMTPEQYRQAMAAQAQARLHGQNGVNTAQTDGADDLVDVASTGVIMRMNANGEGETMGRIEIDNLIRARIEAMGRNMEGGGLMLPLRQTKKSNVVPEKRKRERGLISQNDGLDDDDDDDVKQDEDEDAINSDLDDPDDGLNDEEDDDEGMGHIMLCMYDKVQRVKNKW